jgi:DNA-binding phage protein
MVWALAGKSPEYLDMDVLLDLPSKLSKLMPHLDERQRRLLAAAEAQALGYGGVAEVARASGLSRPTIHKGLQELHESPLPAERVRRAGGGRKKVRAHDPSLVKALERLIDPMTRGDPMSLLRWTCKSTRHLADALAELGYTVSHTTVAELLRHLEYSLQGTAKTQEGKQHPDRDAQFHYINKQSRSFLDRKLPAISVDAKKKELLGTFAKAGQEWQPMSVPEEVNTHDFPDPELGKAIPYGVYDIGRNQGWVQVGCDHDTASFAVQSIRSWWQNMGRCCYPRAPELLINADAGGSNGYRIRLWKVELQRLADDTGLSITVCHFPPGTSKWNKIEHRLFAHITMNWRGRPLTSHEVVVNLIGDTTTRAGLKVKAQLDQETYPIKVKVSDKELSTVNLTRHTFHGDWNYTITPHT